MVPRFSLPACSIILTLFLAGSAFADDPFGSPYFTGTTGHWTGEGELTNQDGEVTPIHEDWSAEKTAEGTFLVSGHRRMGEEEQDFRWEYSFNSTLDLYECEYWHTGMDDPIRFEVSITETSTELRTPFGDPGSELKIRNELTAEGIDGHITLTDSSGQETITGIVKHKRAD